MIAATIAPRFVQPTQTYQLDNATYPAVQAGSEPVDLSLKLEPLA